MLPPVRCLSYLFQSTHPQGVRRRGCDKSYETCKFQSTHPQGVRLRQDHRLPIGKGFNPRTRRGCDQPRAGNCLPYVVSIHAPAGGATMCRVSSRVTRSFNPRTRRGCDEALCLPPAQCHCFNPRTRRGCDTFASMISTQKEVSIHAPAGGATPYPAEREEYIQFQSTHPQGVRPAGRRTRNRLGAFQSTHPQGVRLTGKHGY